MTKTPWHFQNDNTENQCSLSSGDTFQFLVVTYVVLPAVPGSISLDVPAFSKEEVKDFCPCARVVHHSFLLLESRRYYPD